jgi:hypothetical protein
MNKINKGNVVTKPGRLMKMGLPVVTLLVTMMFAALLPGAAFAAGGDFANTDFAAAAPFTYNHATGGGAYNDRTVGDFKDITEQLEGAQFTCGDIVTYLVQIELEATTEDPVQTAEFDFSFLANSTGQAGVAHSEVVGVSINYGSVENGDDGTGTNPGEGSVGLDSGIADDRQDIIGGDTGTGGSTATLISQGLTGPLFQSGSELLATVRIDDLEPGEKIVLRIDTRLACDPGSGPTGNLQGQMNAGRVVEPVEDTINTGEQTIPFLKVGDIAGAGEPLIEIEKTVTTADGTCGVDNVEQLEVIEGDTVKYCYTVINPGTKELFDVELVDDNGTPGNTSDDFNVSLTGLADLDNEGDLGDLAPVATATGSALVTLNSAGTIVNTADASGNNGLTGGNYQVLTDSDTATVVVNEGQDNPPVANDDEATTPEDTPVVINAAANDTDVDGNLDPSSATPIIAPSDGTVVNNNDGTFTYTPDENFNGSDSFMYQVCDTDNLCDTATVTIEVTDVNDPPVAVDDSASTDEDIPVDIDAVANDSDVDDNLDPSTATVVIDPSNGTVTNNGDGTFTYTPDPNFFGTDSFEYEVCDTDNLCDTATVTVAVATGNDPPVAVDDSTSTDEDIPVDIDAVANDSDVDDNLDPSTATVVIDPSNGTVTNNGDGTFTYTPDPNFFGTDSFEYAVCDTDNLCDTATVTVEVIQVKHPPVANDDSATTPEDTPVEINATDNDSDVDNNLDPSTATVMGDPSNGTVTNNGDGTFTYTPNENFSGTDSFVYQVCDTDELCDTATVNIDVTSVNDPPVALNDSDSTDEDTAVTINATANDSDVDGNLDPSSATPITAPSDGTVVNNNDGTFTYTPDENFNGSDSFAYQVCDTDGSCDTATVTIEVTPVNDPPVALNDSASTDEDTAVTINATANDSDVDGNLDPSSATPIIAPSDGTVANNNDGTFTYTPDPNFNGIDSFAYQVCDTDGSCDTATVTVAVAALNDPPVANDDSATTPEDTAVTINATANDSDVDNNLDPSTAAVVSGPSNGQVTNNNDGTFTYTPAENFNGSDSFVYEVCDLEGLCDTAEVIVNVTPVNDPPVAVDDTYSTIQDTTLTVDAPGVLVNDSDVDGDTIVVDSFDAFSQFGGSVSANPDGSFSYTPASGFAGFDTFTYTISDGNGGTDTAMVTITVDARNNRSISLDLQDFTLDETSLSGYFLITNQSDGYDVQIVDMQIEVQYRLPGAGWTYVVVNEGSCSFNPSANFLVVDQQSVDFSGCELAELIPDGATVRVTANVKIFGRIKGKGKADGWFLSRLSK